MALLIESAFVSGFTVAMVVGIVASYSYFSEDHTITVAKQ
jgi:hypothetical protein